MTYKQIEASREARLWIGQVIVPAVTAAATVVVLHPEIKQNISNKFANIKFNKWRNNFKVIEGGKES